MNADPKKVWVVSDKGTGSEKLALPHGEKTKVFADYDKMCEFAIARGYGIGSPIKISITNEPGIVSAFMMGRVHVEVLCTLLIE